MGRLVGLELHNFKSYKGTSSIGFGSSFFTSIIGPNGAGKSNMMDAISFVLGVKSSHLRSQNLKDLIYRGRRTNDSETSFEDPNQDPTRAYVMAIYEKDDGEVLNLKRTITSNGNSEYKINERIVTALNYSTVLKAENILIKARNFLVFQGDVEQIASQSPKDLTQLIETISGSAEYIKEYEKLREEHEKAHDLSNSVFSRKRVLNSESKQYKEQLAEQKEFEDTLTQKSDITKQINLYKLYHNEKKHYQLSDDLNVKNNELKELQDKLASEEEEFNKLMTEYSKESLKAKKDAQQLTQLRKNIELAKRDLIPLEASRKSTSSKVDSCRKRIEVIKNEIEKQKKSVASVERQLRDAERLFRDFQAKVTISTSASVSTECQKEYESLRTEFLANEGAQLEEELSLLANEKDSINARITNYNNQKTNSVSRISELESIVNFDLQPRLSEIDKEIKDILALKQEKIDSRNALIKSKEEYNYKELQLNSQLRDVLVKIDELSSQQRESNKQRRLRENVSKLKKLFPKGTIKGLVYDLVRPSKQKYEAALLTILGKNSDSVIVETTSVAYKCIEILKERRSGVVTVIPLDSIVIEPVNLHYLRSLHELAEPGIDILEYDDKSIEQAINYVVGNSLVVDNIDIAKNLKWGTGYKLDSKVVTLDGSVIHKSGLMTGGQQQQKPSVALSWDKKELNKLNDMKDDLTSKLQKLNESKPKELEINLLLHQINSLDDKLPLLRNKQASITRIIEDRQNEISFQKELNDGFTANISEKQGSLKKIEEKVTEVESKVKILQDQIYSEFCEKYGFTHGIADYENLHGSTLRFRAKERAQFSRSISALTNKLSFEKERLAETTSRKEKLERSLADYEDEFSKAESERIELVRNIDNLEANYEVSSEEKEKIDNELKEKLKHSKVLESKKNEIESEVSDLGKKITNMEELLLKVDMERVNVLKNCKIQNVNIPLKDGLLESISIGEDVDSLVRDIYNIEIDYTILDEKLKESFNSKTEAELEAKLQMAIDHLEKLTPNAKAVERLKEVETKLRNFDKDLTKARQNERKVADKFQDIRSKRYELFMEAFNHISGQIDFIYKELTKSPATPLGGSAYLTLEDEDSPYNSGIKYHAMPPMKRFRDMELLSGGEKTMAALALLFAIHSYQPSPFFVLDEVDAALDNSNVSKIANYIRKYAGPNFQFIVISLKNSLFEKSDALVGIFREQRENSSKTVTLDLRDYPEEDIPMGEGIAAS